MKKIYLSVLCLFRSQRFLISMETRVFLSIEATPSNNSLRSLPSWRLHSLSSSENSLLLSSSRSSARSKFEFKEAILWKYWSRILNHWNLGLWWTRLITMVSTNSSRPSATTLIPWECWPLSLLLNLLSTLKLTLLTLAQTFIRASKSATSISTEFSEAHQQSLQLATATV